MAGGAQILPSDDFAKFCYSVAVEMGTYGPSGINYRNASATERDDVWMDYEATLECQDILKGLSLGQGKECRHCDRGFGPVIITIICVGKALPKYEVVGSTRSTYPYPQEIIVDRN